MTAAYVWADGGQAAVTAGGTSAPAPLTVESWTLSASTLPAVSTGASQCTVADIASGAQTETVLITNISGATATVTRGAEGTTPVAHTTPFTIQCVISQGFLASITPMTTLGDTIYGSANGVFTRLAGSASARKKVFTQTGTGSASAAPAYAEPATDWLNVVDYGADPTGVADSATAIQAAMSAVPANGGTVFFPVGTYLISSALNPTVSGTRLLGAGWGSQIRYDGSVVTAGAIKMGDTTLRRCSIEWLRISQTNATAAGTAIEASYFQDSLISRVLIDGGGASGVPPVVGVSFNAANTYYNVVSDCRINVSGSANIGIRFDAAANSNVVRNCRILPDNSHANGIGVYVNARAIELDHVDVESAAGTGVSLGATGHGCLITHPYLEANNIGIAFASGVNSPVVTGGTVENSVTADFSDSGALTPQFINVRSSAGGEHAYTKVLLDPTFWPDDQGLLAWSYDFVSASPTATAPGAGVVQMIKIAIRRPVTITNVLLCVVATGTLTAGQNFAGLYSASGTLLSATADQTTAWGTTGLKTMALSAAQAVLPGYYYVAFVANGTPCTFARASGVTGSGASLSAGLTASNGRWLTGPTVTALANVNMSTQTTLAGPAWWVAVS